MKVVLTDLEQLTGDLYFLRGIFEQLAASINIALNQGGAGDQVLLDDGSYGPVDVTKWNGTAVQATPGGFFRSLQLVSATMTGTATTGDATLTTTLTNASKVILIPLGWRVSAATVTDPEFWAGTWSVESTTVVRVTRGTATSIPGGATITHRVLVLELL